MSKESVVLEALNLSKTYKICTNQNILGRLFNPIYKEIRAINHLSFSISAGEQVALLGPNGSGKSTTLKLLSGLLKPSAGSVYINQQDPLLQHQNVSQHVSVFFGNKTSLWSRLPVRDSFEYVRVVYNIEQKLFRRRLDELVSVFELHDLIDRQPHTLSLGQKMRCEFVRRLLPAPSVLLLDEPTIGMDVVSKNTFRDLIKKYADKNKTTLLLTSHDTSDIESLCKRVILIKDGQKLFDGTFEELKKLKSHHSQLESILVEMYTEKSSYEKF